MVELSVIIPSYRSKETIGRCLQAVMGQSLAKDLYEVIVVDSSDDGTDEIIRKDFPSVRLIHFPKKTLPGEARNLGVKQATGRYIVFIDTDCVAEEGLLEEMVNSLSNTSRLLKNDFPWQAAQKAPDARPQGPTEPERTEQVREDSGGPENAADGLFQQPARYAGVGGAVRNGTPGSLSGSLEYILSFKEFTPRSPLRLTRHIPSCNLCLRREVFERYGPFPIDFFPGEDAVFNWRIAQAGERLLFDPALQVTHLNRTGFKRVFLHQYRYGKAFAITRSRFPMPGRIFVIFPLLSLFLPLVRWGSVLAKLRWDLRLLGMALLLTPWLWVALTVWAVGFWRQLQEEEDEMARKLR